jgi:hypothetical protein
VLGRRRQNDVGDGVGFSERKYALSVKKCA